MKPTLCLSIILLCCMATVFGQNEQTTNPIGLKKLPSVEVKTLDNKTFNTKDFSNNGKPIIISFWATWCKPCVNELTTISDVYDDWKEETGVKLIAISIDDSKTSGNVSPLVNGKSWDYEVYLDVNSDLRRAMNVNLIPHTFVINGNNEIVWQHTSFSQGSELQLIDIVRKVAKGETLPTE
jgi:cytochrome c biogenesis protein CcmG, thiol:disulfide interchange protein DsbE